MIPSAQMAFKINFSHLTNQYACSVISTSLLILQESELLTAAADTQTLPISNGLFHLEGGIYSAILHVAVSPIHKQ